MLSQKNSCYRAVHPEKSSTTATLAGCMHIKLCAVVQSVVKMTGNKGKVPWQETLVQSRGPNWKVWRCSIGHMNSCIYRIERGLRCIRLMQQPQQVLDVLLCQCRACTFIPAPQKNPMKACTAFSHCVAVSCNKGNKDEMPSASTLTKALMNVVCCTCPLWSLGFDSSC